MIYALLPLRVALGLIFTTHGYLKLFSPRYGPEKFAQYLREEGVGFPTITARVIGWVELAGGLCILLGFLGRIPTAVLAIHVFLALVTVAPKRGFTQLPGAGWEYELLLLAGLATLGLSPGTPFSTDLLPLIRRLLPESVAP